MKNTASLPKGRKLQGLSAPNLVAARRATFREYSKARLLGAPLADSLHLFLTRIDDELARRNITIQNPETSK